jgi:hypothetical protein
MAQGPDVAVQNKVVKDPQSGAQVDFTKREIILGEDITPARLFSLSDIADYRAIYLPDDAVLSAAAKLASDGKPVIIKTKEGADSDAVNARTPHPNHRPTHTTPSVAMLGIIAINLTNFAKEENRLGNPERAENIGRLAALCFRNADATLREEIRTGLTLPGTLNSIQYPKRP